MTKKQKSERILEIKNVIESSGFILDSYGNYVLTKNSKKYRMKMKKINIRFETKPDIKGHTWFSVFSKPIVNISPETLKSFLEKRFI